MSEISGDTQAKTESETGLPALDGLARLLALLGGALAVALALLVSTSITLRALGLGGVRGDFEFVQMGVALIVFAFMPWCQARRGNVMVDSFTSRLPPRFQAALDALWEVVFGAMMALIAWRLGVGAMDAASSSTTTMVLLMPIAPAIAACAALAGLTSVVALAMAVARLRGGA
ncbi:MAG: TRAP transporter small permease subunit [Roseomonas sp.]|nr:TRAP transporter small permease subunit [Roseomonas sp.]MCA3326457.1 TRAP transporter small permease subunit [Roseomonas sp.]MCA3330196.1 TRAP transporter small permease subunit [Roseomonas sp.]MCA3333858.1 TRAP transporter small permease subunit [Roseomonas sp.]MCA3346808.1 TRAP transporter small permease subunit [Roseomonas sp.]